MKMHFRGLRSRISSDPRGKLPNHVITALSLHPWSPWTQETGLSTAQMINAEAPVQLDEAVVTMESSPEEKELTRQARIQKGKSQLRKHGK